MAEGTYQIAGGAFEAFLNFQSLIISVRVYRAIMKQNVGLQNMVSQRFARTSGGDNKSTYCLVLKFKKGELFFMKNVMKKLDADMVTIEKQKLSLATLAERQAIDEKAITQEALTLTGQRVQQENQEFRQNDWSCYYDDKG